MQVSDVNQMALQWISILQYGRLFVAHSFAKLHGILRCLTVSTILGHPKLLGILNGFVILQGAVMPT